MPRCWKNAAWKQHAGWSCQTGSSKFACSKGRSGQVISLAHYSCKYMAVDFCMIAPLYSSLIHIFRDWTITVYQTVQFTILYMSSWLYPPLCHPSSYLRCDQTLKVEKEKARTCPKDSGFPGCKRITSRMGFLCLGLGGRYIEYTCPYNCISIL